MALTIFSNSSTVFHFEINYFEVSVKEMCYRKSCFCASRVPNWPRNEFYVNWVSHCTGSCARRFSTQKLRRPSYVETGIKNQIVWIVIDLLFSFLTYFPEPSSMMTMKVCKEWINFYFWRIHQLQFEMSHRIQIAELDQATNPLVVSDTAFKNRNTRLCLQGFLKSYSRRSRINPLIVDVFWGGKIMFLPLTLMYKIDGIL